MLASYNVQSHKSSKEQTVCVFLNEVSENMLGSFAWDILMDHFDEMHCNC
jgi:hypothetical protein